ncbi:MAG: PDGLE domain-containing protein [Chloroflexota bacterium]
MKSKWWLISLLTALALAGLSPLASSAPDGLERVAENKGFIGLSGETPFQVMADYVFPGIHNEAVATILASLLGTLILFGLAYGLAWVLVSKQKKVSQ